MKKIKIVLKKQNIKTKEIYEEVVKFDENITILNLSNQNLIEIPIGLDQFKFLKSLDLYKNNISKIQFLTADGKSFNENHLINLKELDLSNNQINKIENLDNNINLKGLDLSNNQITKIENLDNLINLTYLNLSKNQISKIENLDNNINLKNLYLDKNQITKIENIHHLEKLEYFWLFDEEQNKNIKESLSISLDNYNLELKEIQIQKQIKEELLKQELKQKKEKEYFDNNFEKLKQQFITSNHQNNDLII